jgi:toxin ParE1/3/4
MPIIHRSPEADDDIVEIASHIGIDNLEAALRWVDTIDAKLRLLSEFPGLGMQRDELAAGLRSLPVGNYLIFYRPIRRRHRGGARRSRRT